MRDDKPLRVAVLGDVHGHLSLAYTILRRWERETLRPLDLILQVGDMGAYPPPYRLDKATKRFAEHDPDELGFAVYHLGEPEAAVFLAPDAPPRTRIAADTVFIRGNHEDFVYLHDLAAGSDGPVFTDPFERIAFLPNGVRFAFERRGITLRVAGLGGVSNHGTHGWDPESEHYTAHDVRALRSRAEPIDVFLSHEPAFDAGRDLSPRLAEQGSRDVAELLTDLRPTYHFCGHWHEPGTELEAPVGVRSYLLHAVNFFKPAKLNPRCMGVLTWHSPERHAWEWIEAPWISRYTRHTWRSLLESDA